MRQNNSYKVNFDKININWEKVFNWLFNIAILAAVLGFFAFITSLIKGCVEDDNRRDEYIRKEAKEIYLGTLEKLDKKSAVTLTSITSSDEEDKFFLVINEKDPGIGYGCITYKRNLFISINDSLLFPKVSFFSRKIFKAKYTKESSREYGIDSIPSNILTGNYYKHASYSDKLMIVIRRQDIPLYIDKWKD